MALEDDLTAGVQWQLMKAISHVKFCEDPGTLELVSGLLWGVTWYLLCLVPLFIGLASMFILIVPFVFFSEMATLRMQSMGSAGLTSSMMPFFLSFFRCTPSLS